MAKTTIDWADMVWNPVTGCTKVSSGCKNCYAERIAARFWKGRPFSDVQCHADRLQAPAKWQKPRRVFVNSMSDLFHEQVSDAFIFEVFKAMSLAPQHIFMVLTKRPERMPGLIPKIRNRLPDRLNHVWLGVSAEDQNAADKRIPCLLQTPAAVRFVSVEPMLEHVKLQGWDGHLKRNYLAHDYIIDFMRGPLDWVICGGESGPGARYADPDWVRSLRDQCQENKVPFFFKSWGFVRGAGHALDGVEYREFPEVR